MCHHFLDKGDANSTGNLCKHIKNCWGEKALKAAKQAQSVDGAKKYIIKALNKSGSIDIAFACKKGIIRYSHVQHTKTETRTELVHCILENLHPFSIIKD